MSLFMMIYLSLSCASCRPCFATVLIGGVVCEIKLKTAVAQISVIFSGGRSSETIPNLKLFSLVLQVPDFLRLFGWTPETGDKPPTEPVRAKLKPNKVDALSLREKEIVADLRESLVERFSTMQKRFQSVDKVVFSFLLPFASEVTPLNLPTTIALSGCLLVSMQYELSLKIICTPSNRWLPLRASRGCTSIAHPLLHCEGFLFSIC